MSTKKEKELLNNSQKENLIEIEIDGVKFQLTQEEVEEFKNFETEKLPKSSGGNNVSIFKNSDCRHKWQKYVKKNLKTFAKIAGVSEKLQKVFATSLKNEFVTFVTKYNETHTSAISSEIKMSDLRNLSAANVSSELIEATSEKVVFGLNYCLNLFNQNEKEK